MIDDGGVAGGVARAVGRIAAPASTTAAQRALVDVVGADLRAGGEQAARHRAAHPAAADEANRPGGTQAVGGFAGPLRRPHGLMVDTYGRG